MTNRVYDKNGFFKSEGNPIARSGILEYAGSSISPKLEPDRIYKVWRPESELNNPETIESFKLVPWFSRHEMTGDNFTPAEQIGVQGVTGEEIYFDENDKTLKNTIKAFGSSLRKMIDQGIKDLSIGMTCDWVIKGGVTPDGEPYDVMQVNIRGNHLASVYEGRAGKGVAVMDSSEVLSFAMDELDFKPTNENEGSDMDLKELFKKVQEAKPAQEELAKLHAEIGAMLNGGEPEAKAEIEAKDEETEVEVEAEDTDEEKKSPVAMDAASVQAIVTRATKELEAKIAKLEGSAMDQASIVKAINAKNVLASQVSKHVGSFDHAEMSSEQEVAQYGVKKLGIACDSGAELSTLKGWLAAKAPAKIIVDSGAQDGADNKPKSLEEMGL
jgi:uncharacterized protein